MRGKAQATLELEQAILEIVEERAPITVRGVGYRLFVLGLFRHEHWLTQKVSRIMTAMREERRLDWRKIVDDSRTQIVWEVWDDPETSIKKAAVDGYRRDNWQEQPQIVEVWSGKGHRAAAYSSQCFRNTASISGS